MSTVRTEDEQFVLPTGTVTLLLADVEGSTRLWESRPDDMTSAMGRLNELVTETVGAHGGVRPLEQGEGDSFVAAFSRASEAVACALEIQRILASEQSPIAVRMGIHTGEVQERGGVNYTGTEVNRCARLREIAHGGQIVLSRATNDLVADHLPEGASLQDTGTHRLRDLSRPEHVFQLDHADLRSDFPPLRSLDSIPNNLPVRLTSFVGRQGEIAEVRTLLDETRMINLAGSGGCGKTRLALQIAAEVLDAYTDGVWLVDVAAVTDAELVPVTAAAAIGLRQEQGRTFTQTLVAHLAQKRMLIVLDNCEQVRAACAELADALLRGCPSLTILATSRETLGVESEVVWRVPSLSAPAEHTRERIETLAQYEAVELFIDRAKRARPSFHVTDENAPAVAQICHRLDGIPLAIELAAARTRVLSPLQICDGLARRFELLSGGARTVVPRHQTLRASMDWSHDLLSEEERSLLRRLSVFAGGFTLEAAEDVCLEGVLDVLTQLIDRSMVVVDEAGDAVRYRLLETIRQYGAEQLSEADEDAVVCDRHAAFFASMCEEAEPHLTRIEQKEWFARLAAEDANLRGAYEWAHERGNADAQLRLCAPIWQYWYNNGRYDEGRNRLIEAAAAQTEDSRLKAKALVGTTYIDWMRGDMEEGAATAAEALEIARRVGDRYLEADALHRLADHIGRTDASRGSAMIDEAERLARAVGDDGLIAAVLGDSAWAHLDEPLVARPLSEEAIERARRSGNDQIARQQMDCLVYTTWFLGNLRSARVLAEELATESRSVGDKDMLHSALIWLTHFRFELGEPDPWTALDEAEYVGESMYAAGMMMMARAHHAWAVGDPLTVELMREWIPVYAVWAPAGQPQLCLAECELAFGLAEDARGHLDEALPILRQYGGASSVRGLLVKGRLDGDEDMLHEALSNSARLGMRLHVAQALECLAVVASNQESHREATRLTAAAQAIRDAAASKVRYAPDGDAHESDLAKLRNALGKDAFEEAWAEGAAMLLDEAIAYAQRGRGERKRPSAGWASLTPTELEVAKHVAEGLRNADIAERMFISRHTVESHLKHIYAKLGLSSRTELALEATRRERSDA